MGETILRKLIVFSIISVNLGYTGFLFPLLSMIYKDKMPLTLFNLVAFILVDTISGVILAVMIHLTMYIGKMSIVKSITFSIISLWVLFWLIAICMVRDLGDIVVICMDGFAAFLSWVALIGLTKYFIKKDENGYSIIFDVR